MKALKSDLAKAVLADPKARDKLRSFLVSTPYPVGGKPKPDVVIEVETRHGVRRITPIVVSKAT